MLRLAETTMQWRGFALYFTVAVTSESLCKGQIVFSQEPKNVTVFEGMDAFFPCTYHGTSGIPTWRITNTSFATSALPPRHSYNGSGLVVSSVNLSLNMSSYSCFFSVYVGGGQFVDVNSSTGFLIIAAVTSLSTIQLKPSSSIQYTEPKIYYPSTTVFIEQTITVSEVELSLDALDSRAQPVATEHMVPLTPIMQQPNLTFVIGVAAGVGILILISTGIITVICVVRQRGQALQTAGNDALSNTKEKKVDINMKENVAYEIPPSRIKMTENEAYGTLPKRT